MGKVIDITEILYNKSKENQLEKTTQIFEESELENSYEELAKAYMEFEEVEGQDLESYYKSVWDEVWEVPQEVLENFREKEKTNALQSISHLI